jgi:glycosyltransferase involved in cell wall biosynthesis
VTVYANTPAPRKVEGVQYRRSSDLAGNLDAAGCDIFLSCRAHDVVDRISRSCAIGLWCHDPPDTGTIGLTEKGLRKASFAFFLSEFHRNEFAKHIPSLAPFARVTSNGVDHDAIDMVLRGRNLVSGRPKFIFGARPVRGLEFLLTEIWPQIVTDLPGAELLVSGYDFGALCQGDGGRLERNREWNNFFGELIRNQPGVRSLGSLHRRRFWEEMAKCTAVLYPTDTPEVNCMIALEAQALGVPMVTTDDFALRETLGFKPTRVQAPWGTPNYVTEFVAATVRLVQDPEFAEEARKAGARHVSRETHSWDAIAEAWEALFHDEVTRRLAFHSSPKVSALVLGDFAVAEQHLELLCAVQTERLETVPRPIVAN